ncbi:beta-galactosidase [Candidatus Uhrbacteria bacterium]|nr:beta-galactosidase [Candidatus Uhrbacteria bacterium]
MKFLQYKKILIALGVVVVFVAWWISLAGKDYSNGREPVWGVTFSKSQAEYLGLDWKKTYLAALDDLGVRAVRLSVYWNAIEHEQGKYDFTDLDWQIAEATKRHARIILAVGRRLPRWPECHDPVWVSELFMSGGGSSAVEAQQFQFVEETIERYKNNPSIAMWQVENEYFLNLFGECPRADKEQFAREIALVRSIDARPILVTDSGELSTWRKPAPFGDYLGTTMYRVVWNKFIGYWRYTYLLPPALYRWKAALVGKAIDRMIGAELQAEPWAPNGLLALAPGEYKKSLDAKQFVANIDFARRTGFPEHYLWGVEYWYWLKEKQNDAMLWDAAKRLFATALIKKGSRLAD